MYLVVLFHLCASSLLTCSFWNTLACEKHNQHLAIFLLSSPSLSVGCFCTIILIYDDGVGTNSVFLHQFFKIVQRGRGHLRRSTWRRNIKLSFATKYIWSQTCCDLRWQGPKTSTEVFFFLHSLKRRRLVLLFPGSFSVLSWITTAKPS